eukprot:scaffold6393_cov60-Phaeocystis_antarctica.AAC.2
MRRGRGHTGLVTWAAAPPCCLWFPWRDLDEIKWCVRSSRGQGWRRGFLGWHSRCCSSQRRRKPRQRHSSPLLESSCPKPSPAGQARPTTSVHTCAPKVRPFFRAPPNKEDLVYLAPAAAKISAGRQDRRFREENPGGHVGVAGGDCRNEVVDASFLVPVLAARPT